MNEEILTWLKGSLDYETGVVLYEKYGTSFSLKRLHRMNGNTKSTMLSITYELSGLVKNAPPPRRVNIPIHSPAPVPVRPQPKITPVKEGRRPNTPEVDALKEEVIGLLKIRDQLHATLEHVKKTQRAKDAKMIQVISEDIARIYDRLDHYEKHGVLPGKAIPAGAKKVIEMTEVELIKRQDNLRTYLSRYKRKLKSVKTPAKRQEYRQLLDKYQLELNDVEKRLTK